MECVGAYESGSCGRIVKRRTTTVPKGNSYASGVFQSFGGVLCGRNATAGRNDRNNDGATMPQSHQETCGDGGITIYSLNGEPDPAAVWGP